MTKHFFSIAAALLGVLLIAATHAEAQSFFSWDDDGNTTDKRWSNAGNWDPDGTPGLNSVVTVGDLLEGQGDTTLFDDNSIQISSLEISNGAGVVNSTDNGLTDDYRIDVSGETQVHGNGSRMVLYGGDSRLPVFGRYALNTGTLDIGNGSSLILDSTTPQGVAVVRVNQGPLTLDAGAELRGTGLVRLDAPTTGGSMLSDTLFVNRGVITVDTVPASIGAAPQAGTLQITAASPDAFFDWHGVGLGEINVNGNQTLDVDVATSGIGFGGTMNLATGSTLDMAISWAVGGGSVNISTPDFGPVQVGQDPSPGAPAVITGAAWGHGVGSSISLNNAWDSLQIDSTMVAFNGSNLTNHGTITFNAQATFQNLATFDMVGDDASLVINSKVTIETEDFNLDGNGLAGNTTTINSNGFLDLNLGSNADETFDHTIQFNGGGRLDVRTLDNDWAISSGGAISVDGGGLSTIFGETLLANGVVSVSGDSTLSIAAPTRYGSTASVSIEAGSVLDHATTSYDGGSYTGAGVLKKGNATILGDTTWGVDTVDIDDGSTTINSGASLVVIADAIDSIIGNGINSTVTIDEAGDLEIALNDGGDVRFEAGSLIQYRGGATQHTFLRAPSTGSVVVLGEQSELEVEGAGASGAVLRLDRSTVNILDANGHLLLEGGGADPANANRMDDAVIAGPGELQIASGRALYGNGVISARIDGDGTAALVAVDNPLTLSGGIQDIGLLSVSGGFATLDVTNPWNTNVADSVVLDEGKIVGATITNNNAIGIRGQGEVASQLINNTRVLADVDGGLLLLSNPGSDWDGLTNTGTLRAEGGDLRLQDNSNFSFQGSVESVQGSVETVGFGLSFLPGSILRLDGGLYASDGDTDFGGAIRILPGSPSSLRIKASSTFQSGAAAVLAETLRLEGGESLIEAGANFSGGGVLHNTSSNSLTLADGSNVGVALLNSGHLALGAAPAEATVLDFQQEATGLLEIDLAGTSLIDYDRLDVNGIAQLDGVLALSLLSGVTLSLNDSFTVVSAVAGVNGIFSEIDLTQASLDSGLGWEVVYEQNAVRMVVVEIPSLLAGDYNDDGVVDAADYTVWRDSLGKATSLPNDETPGAVTQSDYDVWVTHYGSVASGAANSPVAVPEPATWLLVSIGLAQLGCRRKG